MNQELRDTLMRNHYLLPSEKTAEEAFKRAAYAFSPDEAVAERIYKAACNGWMMFASPVLSNAPAPDGTWNKGLPISCFLNYVPDSLEGLIDHTSETRWLSVKGGGVGGHWSDVRAVSDIAPGPIPFIHTIDADVTAYKQGRTRKGSYAAYLDISHPDIEEFIQLRLPTGGDLNRKALNIHHAVNISDAFIRAVLDDLPWALVDPKTGEKRAEINARSLWEHILTIRARTGEPYLFFIDTANRAMPESMKEAGLRINGSNLCNEITLPTSDDRTAVCCLSSVNLEKYDEWKDTPLVEDMVLFLNGVLDFFIENAPDTMAKAVHSAKTERSIGIGAMGWAYLLQKNMIPWDDWQAASLTNSIFQTIKSRAVAMSEKLREERGPIPLHDTQYNSHLLAIAPNANSGLLCGTSASIEPVIANAYTHRTRAGSHFIRNRYLEQWLEGEGRNTPEVWQDITEHNGSIQHIDWVPDDVKNVFKTAYEIDQRVIVELAGIRQQHLCQSQSINLFFKAGVDRAYVNAVHLKAWNAGLKGLYYYRSTAEAVGEKISAKVARVSLKDFDECVSCQG